VGVDFLQTLDKRDVLKTKKAGNFPAFDFF
jgi:hypothetical protein